MDTVLNWSSGKDAAMAYYLLDRAGEYEITHLLTTVNAAQDRVVMHGVRESLLDAQAQRMGLPLKKVMLPPSPADAVYKDAMGKALDELKLEGVTAAAFGDIFLEDLKVYREAQLTAINIKAVFPLWKMPTKDLLRQVEDAGIKAMIVCVNERCLGKEFLGRTVGRELLEDLPPSVDPCGENGEYHTFVCDAPFFSTAVNVSRGPVVYREYPSGNQEPATGFYFLDLYESI